MGINTTFPKWLSLMKRRHGVDLSTVCMLGRQNMADIPLESWREDLSAYFDVSKILQPDGYAESFWRQLAGSDDAKIDSVDYSNYEGANIILDLNEPLPEEHHGRWSAVYDGGTLEHVFNYPQALRNAMCMVRLGGHLFLATITNGFCNHGFYQFSPTLFFSIFVEENGYRLLDMTAVKGKSPAWRLNWDHGRYIPNFGRGGEMQGMYDLLVCAERIGDVPETLRPYQRFFVERWTGAAGGGGGAWCEEYDLDAALKAATNVS